MKIDFPTTAPSFRASFMIYWSSGITLDQSNPNDDEVDQSNLVLYIVFGIIGVIIVSLLIVCLCLLFSSKP